MQLPNGPLIDFLKNQLLSEIPRSTLISTTWSRYNMHIGLSLIGSLQSSQWIEIMRKVDTNVIFQ